MALDSREMEAKKRRKVRLKAGDEVIVISGREKGKRGAVRFVDKKRDRVVVEGLNKVKRFQRPTQENPKGGVLEMEFGIPISNVMFYDAKTKSGKRVGYLREAGERKRVVRSKKETREIKEKAEK
ncbi:MAG: 50S ribosomal protein L24 [Leptospirales bacterium]|nr:50S ribosomal protein L24 [Leptospirales bacterium]